MSGARPSPTTALIITSGFLAGAFLTQTPAAAHSGHGTSGTDSGLLHLLFSLHHLGAMIAVGILAATIGVLTVAVGFRRMAVVLGAILSGTGLAVLLGV
jgi:hydrogenase/urease accessory protein HupE